MGESKYYVPNIPTIGIAPKKKTLRPSQAKSERVQLNRAEYWSKVKNIDFKDLVFLDEMGVLLGLMRTHARAAPGERAYNFKPFYRGGKVSVVGAITVSKVLGVMTLDGSMDSAAFEVYISRCLVPQLWKGAVVVMDNLPAHKVKAIAPLIEAAGAKILYLSPYSPEFNPIEHWWCSANAQIVVLRRLGRECVRAEVFLKAVLSKNLQNG